MPNRSTKNPLRVQEMVRRRVRRRQLWRRTRIGALVAGAIVVVGGAAFGIDRMVVALTRYYGSPTHTSSHQSTPITSGSTTTVAAGPPGCVGAQLTGTVANWQATAGTTYETVTLTNISTSTCTLDGFPALGANAQNGAALPAPTRNVATLGSSSSSPSSSAPASAPAPVSVAPGATGWFELAFSDVCSQVLTPGAAPSSSSNACYPGISLQVTPPKTTSSLLVTEPFRFDYGTSGFEVGPLLSGSPPSSPPIGP